MFGFLFVFRRRFFLLLFFNNPSMAGTMTQESQLINRAWDHNRSSGV